MNKNLPIAEDGDEEDDEEDDEDQEVDVKKILANKKRIVNLPKSVEKRQKTDENKEVKHVVQKTNDNKQKQNKPSPNQNVVLSGKKRNKKNKKKNKNKNKN